MRDVARVDDERRAVRHGADLLDGRLQRCLRRRVRLLAEADVAVADLYEAQRVLRHGCIGGADQVEGLEHAALHHPDNAGAGPGRALQQAAATQLGIIPISICSAHLRVSSSLMRRRPWPAANYSLAQ